MSNLTHQSEIGILNQAGAAKLREMSAGSMIYAQFLKFQGRVYKQNATVALEFFAQNPEAKFIANAKQWTAAGYKIKDGGEAIRFADGNGKHIDLYDFSQIEGGSEPPLWTISKGNASIVKTMLAIPADKNLIGGMIAKTMTNGDITDCMERLGIPPNEFDRFSKAYVDAVQTITATPVNNGFSDLRHQLELADDGNPEIINEKLDTRKSIDVIFRQAQGAFNKWSALQINDRTTENLLGMLDFEFFTVLDSVTIARSRKHIEKYYNIDEIGKFPERMKPLKIYAALTDLPNAITFDEIHSSLMNLTLAVYTPMQVKFVDKLNEVEKTEKILPTELEKIRGIA